MAEGVEFMNRKLKGYLENRGAKELDTSVLEALKREMNERTIPEIVKNIKQNEQNVAEIRFSPKAASRHKKRD